MNNHEVKVLSPLAENRPSPRNIPRLFRSPPQPHMCVQDTLVGSQVTCFINVMSWNKIGLPTERKGPIPLYGGIKVPLNERCSVSSSLAKEGRPKPMVFAVLVNPYVLKQSGKYSENAREREELTDLILDFIEAMNENIKFSRKFTVLKDRDLTGELKEIWAVIEAKRNADKNCSNNHHAMPDENSQPACISPNANHNTTELEGGASAPTNS